jgi:hypothetical protein
MTSLQTDYYIEKFWLDFKQSMDNFYSINKTFCRPIKYWSDKLNELQTNKNYDSIEKNIRDYMSLYAIDLLRTNSEYHINILISNIKRWNSIASQLNRFEKSESKYINIVFLLIDIYKTLYDYNNDEIKYLFSTVELYIIYQDFSFLIDFAIKNNKPSIIDKINEYNDDNCIKYIENKYNVKLSPKMSARKIFNKLS